MQGPDRRVNPTPMISRHTLWGGRRQSRRRLTDPEIYYVDRFGAGISMALLLIFTFHVLDAIFTIIHLGRGGTEANPLMDFLIQRSDMLFIVVKLSVAGLGLAFLGMHKNFPHVKRLIGVIFAIFAALIGYHVLLLLQA